MKKQDFKVLKTKDLYPFPDNPFHVAEDETLSELAESIKEFGIVTPIITRPKEDGNGYEVIAGQRRVRASELAGINTVPAFVLPLDRDRAIITLVDSNLQRENILPSERAFAYKMKSEAMKRQGFRTDLTSSQVVTKLRTDDKVAQGFGVGRMTVQRFIRLTELIPPILQMVDEGKIALTPAVELSFLKKDEQEKAKALEKEQRKLNKRLAELDRLFSSLYEDKVMERITERNFEMMSGKYQKEQLEIEARLKEVTETLSDSYEKTQGVRDFLSLIRNYQGIKELDATIINALIDKILVSEREKLTDGMVRQEIKIYYKFIGFVGELHITPTKRWTALKPKNCTVCGVEYVPRSGISKYCPACAKKIQREKSNESKRRSRERNRQACIELSAKNDRLTLPSAKAVSSARATRTPLSMCTAM